MPISGRVVEEQKAYFIVDTPEGPVRAKTRGVMKKERTKICSGDFVDIQIINESPREGVILSVHKRTSYLKRPAVANLSQIFFIVTLKSPSLDFEALDRFLFSAEVFHLKSFIVFNKTDLLDEVEKSELDDICSAYRKIGYQTLQTTAFTDGCIDELLSHCTNEVSAFAGPSGVGKSTLLSKIFPEKTFRIGDVSGATGRGTHTTTNVSLQPLKSGGYLADTPGISFVDIPTIPEEEVINNFPELLDQIGQCRFNNCIHDGEPGCRIEELVENKEIMESRKYHYLKIFKEMKGIRKLYR
jgi:ribosome biogenesis GTPase